MILDMMHPTVELNLFIGDSVIERHLAARDIRPDVFDFDRRPRMERTFAEERFYAVSCRRYYETADWKDCLELALDELGQAGKRKRLAADRAAPRVWESMYYHGRVRGDDDMQARALALFRSPAGAMTGGTDEIR